MTSKSVALLLLIINLILYIVVSATAGWAINYSIEETPQLGYFLFIPVRLFPLYFPMGNMATGFFTVFCLIAGVVGIATSLSGINNVRQWNVSNLQAASTAAIIAWSLTLLAMGVACKEINIGWRNRSLRTLEALMIVSKRHAVVLRGGNSSRYRGSSTVQKSLLEEFDLGNN